jgi:hypothetical protein
VAKAKVVNLKTGRGVAAAFKKLIPKIEAAGYSNVQSTRRGVMVDRRDAQMPWDRNIVHSQFGGSSTIGGCCGVTEITSLWRQHISAVPGTLPEDVPTLFAAQLHAALKADRTRLAIATSIPKQRGLPAILERVGFFPVTTTVNPKTRQTVTLWTYHRA